MSHPLPFTAPWLLAPMEGVTESCFRDLVLRRNSAQFLGGAFTEFVSVAGHSIRASRLREHLGPERFEAPVGIQLMGSNLEFMAATAANAAHAGAPLLDINFGCPTQGTLRTCAGSALLTNPPALEKIINSCVRAAGSMPVTGKIRAGFDNDLLLTDLARAVEAGGASMLTLHCRTRAEGYQDCADWSRIERAVRSVTIPVCGNGGVKLYSDLERMRRETGCSFVMIGRAALGNPWIFSHYDATAKEAAEFLLEYAFTLVERRGFSLQKAASRVKQLIHFWSAGALITGGKDSWLKEPDPERLLRTVADAGGLDLNWVSGSQS
ncbi:MAG: tRNA dihydrouridine synthase [Planctomycetota bacterium]